MKKIVTTLGLAGAMLAAPLAVNAAPLLYNWDYTVSTDWVPGSTTFTSSVGQQSASKDVITWGAPGADYHAGSQGLFNSQSAITITGSPASGTAITNGPIVPTSTIRHYNNTLSDTFGTLKTTDLITTLSLDANPGGGAPAGSPFSKTFMVRFIETENKSPCFADSASVCDDIFVLGLTDLLQTFDFKGVTYTATIIGALGTLPDSACLAAGAPIGCLGLQTQEDQITAAPFAFKITAQIPEPGILALLGIGLAGVGFASRRRSGAAA